MIKFLVKRVIVAFAILIQGAIVGGMAWVASGFGFVLPFWPTLGGLCLLSWIISLARKS